MAMVSKVETRKQLKEMFKFFKAIPDNSAFDMDFSKYEFLLKMGEAYGLYEGNKLVGGVFQYKLKTHNIILNYFVPKKYSLASEMREIMFILLEQVDRTFPNNTFIETNNPEAFKRYIKHIDGDIYQVMFPSRRL